jgi:hypothetical protein
VGMISGGAINVADQRSCRQSCALRFAPCVTERGVSVCIGDIVDADPTFHPDAGARRDRRSRSKIAVRRRFISRSEHVAKAPEMAVIDWLMECASQTLTLCGTKERLDPVLATITKQQVADFFKVVSQSEA